MGSPRAALSTFPPRDARAVDGDDDGSPPACRDRGRRSRSTSHRHSASRRCSRRRSPSPRARTSRHRPRSGTNDNVVGPVALLEGGTDDTDSYTTNPNLSCFRPPRSLLTMLAETSAMDGSAGDDRWTMEVAIGVEEATQKLPPILLSAPTAHPLLEAHRLRPGERRHRGDGGLPASEGCRRGVARRGQRRPHRPSRRACATSPVRASTRAAAPSAAAPRSSTPWPLQGEDGALQAQCETGSTPLLDARLQARRRPPPQGDGVH